MEEGHEAGGMAGSMAGRVVGVQREGGSAAGLSGGVPPSRAQQGSAVSPCPARSRLSVCASVGRARASRVTCNVGHRRTAHGSVWDHPGASGSLSEGEPSAGRARTAARPGPALAPGHAPPRARTSSESGRRAPRLRAVARPLTAPAAASEGTRLPTRPRREAARAKSARRRPLLPFLPPRAGLFAQHQPPQCPRPAHRRPDRPSLSSSHSRPHPAPSEPAPAGPPFFPAAKARLHCTLSRRNTSSPRHTPLLLLLLSITHPHTPTPPAPAPAARPRAGSGRTGTAPAAPPRVHIRQPAAQSTAKPSENSQTSPRTRSARFLNRPRNTTPPPEGRRSSATPFASFSGDARTGDPRRVHDQMLEFQRRRQNRQRIRRVSGYGIHKEEGRQPFAPGAQILDCAHESRPSPSAHRRQLKPRTNLRHPRPHFPRPAMSP